MFEEVDSLNIKENNTTKNESWRVIIIEKI